MLRRANKIVYFRRKQTEDDGKRRQKKERKKGRRRRGQRTAMMSACENAQTDTAFMAFKRCNEFKKHRKWGPGDEANTLNRLMKMYRWRKWVRGAHVEDRRGFTWGAHGEGFVLIGEDSGIAERADCYDLRYCGLGCIAQYTPEFVSSGGRCPTL